MHGVMCNLPQIMDRAFYLEIQDLIPIYLN